MGFSRNGLKWQKWMCLFSILTGSVPKSVVNGDPVRGYSNKKNGKKMKGPAS